MNAFPMNAGILTTFHFFINVLDFGTTGTAVHVSQSAVSRPIPVLEEDLGAQLFTPERVGVTLTEAGEL
jgi:DNA-binding transcriptional LysR family regulator